MAIDIAKTAIFHITDVSNLPSILAAGGLLSDAALAANGAQPQVIGYGHIKHRRMHVTRVPCQANRFVGEFVPFYYCPRSPMLYTINRGNTGRPPGCQQSIVHLVSTVAEGVAVGQPWAISDGNAGASYPSFSANLATLDGLDWSAIRANSWSGRTNEKMAEFLVADFFPWASIKLIGCQNDAVAGQVSQFLAGQAHQPVVQTKANWYY